MKNLNISLFVKFFLIALLFPMYMTGQTSIITEVFQPGPIDGQDAIVHYLTDCTLPANYHNTNYGNATILMAREWSFNQSPENCDNGTTRTFIRFDEINSLPVNAIIINAELFLYADPTSSANSNSSSNAIEIGRVINSWDEQTLTWSNMPSLIDYSDGITHGESTQSHEDISIVVTSIVQDQFSGINNGFSIKLITESQYSRWTWASSNNGTTSIRPKLEVKYYIPCDANFTYCYNTATSEFTFSTNTVQPGTGYIWHFGDGTSVGTLGQPVNHSYAAPGYYSVCHELKGGCRVCIDICITPDQVKKPLPKKVKTEEKNVKHSNEKYLYLENFYPNPTKDQITLEINATNKGIANLTIYDLTGKKVGAKSYNLDNGMNQVKFNLPELSSGIYLCTILMDGAHIERKFVVE